MFFLSQNREPQHFTSPWSPYFRIFPIYIYLRAAAPAADPGKEKAGFIRVFCELSAWMLYIYIIYIYIYASNSIYLCVELKFC